MDLNQNAVKLVLQDLDHRFAYHAPNELQQRLHQQIRDMHKALAIQISKHTPVCREQALAITKLEESMMWANAAIARNKAFYEGRKDDKA